MPLSATAIKIAGLSATSVEASAMTSVANTSTSLTFLSGIIPIPLPSVLADVISPGTLLISVGLFFIIQNVLLGIVYEYDDDDDYYDDDEECDGNCCDCGEDCGDDDFRMMFCPHCNEEIYFDESIEPSELTCPACGKKVCDGEDGEA